jgi:selenocysteine lyase/cysteine desulfurase
LTELPAYKVNPAADSLPDKWMTGTQNHEGIAGVLASIAYLAELGGQFGPVPNRRAALAAAFRHIVPYERQLCTRLVEGLSRLSSVRTWGIVEPDRFAQRVPTVAITHRRLPPIKLAEHLAKRGIFAWHGNFYAWELSHALGQEPEGLLRIGLLHYNTADEVDRVLSALAELE